MSSRDARRADLLDSVPCGVVVIDRSLHIVDANRAFRDVFGDVVGQSCYLATRGRNHPCMPCAAEQVFADGQPRAFERDGRDRSGRPSNYLVQVAPLRSESGEIDLVASITTDVTAAKTMQREYQMLFERVPCYVTVLNRDLRVVRANEMFRTVFGDATGERCYTLYKRRKDKCPDCPAERTFADGEVHTCDQIGMSRDGRPTHYAVSTAPLRCAEGEVSHVIEMAVDVTQAHGLEEQLARAHALREVLVEHAPYGVIVLDAKRHVALANRRAEVLLGRARSELVGHKLPAGLLPDALRGLIAGREESCEVNELTIRRGDEEVPVRLFGVRLPGEESPLGSAVFLRDLSNLKRLEREKLEAERLAAVGQTVAGLAHGIKNILTGLEGGMYVTSTGLKRNDDQRLRQGWEMLERNIGKISALVKNLLAFSRGEEPKVTVVEPGDVLREVVELFRESAEQHGLTVSAEVAEVRSACLDRDGLHTALANLLSNSLDACLVSNNPACSITARVRDDGDVLVFEVSDSGCGMDYEVKQRVFTSFFTTKGAGGTGLGLLLTRKIAQQHGGTVTFETTPGAGTTFRLAFPRSRLPKLPQPSEKGGS